MMNRSLVLWSEFRSGLVWCRRYYRQQPVPMQLLLLLCLNLVLAPAVQAATGGELSTGQVFWLTLLGLLTLGISIYLFVVIFQPERF